MPTGIQQINAELKRVRQNPNKTIQADYDNNRTGQLIAGALTLINNNLGTYPNDWDEKFKAKIKNYSYNERLAVAGVFLAAEIDRYELYLDKIENYAKHRYNLSNKAAKEYRNCGGWDNFYLDDYTPESAVDEDMSCA